MEALPTYLLGTKRERPGTEKRTCGRCGDPIWVSPVLVGLRQTVAQGEFACRGCTLERRTTEEEDD